MLSHLYKILEALRLDLYAHDTIFDRMNADAKAKAVI